MTEIEIDVYNWRLHEGDIVYFVKADEAVDSTLVMKKAIVGAKGQDDYSQLIILSDTGTCGRQLTSELFVTEEVQEVIEDITELQSYPVDQLFQDPIRKGKLASALFAAVMDRMGDDLNKPFDLEN